MKRIMSYNFLIRHQAGMDEFAVITDNVNDAWEIALTKKLGDRITLSSITLKNIIEVVR